MRLYWLAEVLVAELKETWGCAGMAVQEEGSSFLWM